MDNYPLVSIVMPTYNRAYLLSDAIDGVLNQTYRNWELIIVDDKSTDNTAFLVKKFSEADPRIKYYFNKRKKGVSGARNCGITAAKGNYIAFLDCDDLWLEHHLTDSIKVLTNENIDVCFSKWLEKSSGVLYKYDELEDYKIKLANALQDLNPLIKGNLIFFDTNFCEYSFLNDFYCTHICTMVFNKNIITKTGLFDEKLLAGEDTDFQFRVFENFGFCLINDFHYIYHENNDSLYNFINLHNVDIDKITTIINNRYLADKLTFCGKYQNKVRKKFKKYIRNSKLISSKEEWLDNLNKNIAAKYFTLGFINQKHARFKSFFYYVLAILNGYDKFKAIYLMKIFFPRFYKKVENEFPALNLG